jgi:ParB family chromosome partitioning protein
VVVQDISDAALLEVALIENIQREDLSPIETARAFERLSRDMGLSQDEIGRRTGKDRATIANFIRLMRLPTEVQEMVGNGQLSMGHAKAILSLHGPDDQVELARKIVKGGLSVRQTEHEAQVALGDKEPAKPKKDAPEDPNVRAAVEALERALGTRVRIVQSGGERGRIEVEYYSQAELDRLYYLLAGEER